jgi:hypothetical protein
MSVQPHKRLQDDVPELKGRGISHICDHKQASLEMLPSFEIVNSSVCPKSHVVAEMTF